MKPIYSLGRIPLGAVLALLAGSARNSDDHPCTSPEGFPSIAHMLSSPKRWQFLFDHRELDAFRAMANGLGFEDPAGLQRVVHPDELETGRSAYFVVKRRDRRDQFYRVVDSRHGKVAVEFARGQHFPLDEFKDIAHSLLQRDSGSRIYVMTPPTEATRADNMLAFAKTHGARDDVRGSPGGQGVEWAGTSRPPAHAWRA